ncbi:MAG: cell division protein FtsA [Chloroflexi bacterium]|nr:cell division protein FtsA [Chloroflexota bacterium]
MSRDRTIVAIDVGTTKICTLVGEVGKDDNVSVLGVGVAPSKGLSKGVVVNIEEAVGAIASSVERAERLSGFKIGSAYVGIAGGHISSLNSRGVIAISRTDRDITPEDVGRAVEAARAIAIPAQREIIHVIPRAFIVDGQDGVRDPIGMSGFRLEVETHIVTGAVTSVHNLIKCVQKVGAEIDELVLQPLASSEAALTDAEKDLGVVLVDIGGGTTDIAIFIEGSIWHTVVLPVAGNHLTNDIATVCRIPFDAGERLKIEHGQAMAEYGPASREDDDFVEVDGFETGSQQAVSKQLLSEIIQARMHQLFSLVLEEIKRSGYDGMLPAGVVLTGGSAQLTGIAEAARSVLQMPVRIGAPRKVSGMAETLGHPAYATSVGLLHWGARHGRPIRTTARSSQEASAVYGRFKGWLREFLP